MVFLGNVEVPSSQTIVHRITGECISEKPMDARAAGERPPESGNVNTVPESGNVNTVPETELLNTVPGPAPPGHA
jgi:hypothetical protein